MWLGLCACIEDRIISVCCDCLAWVYLCVMSSLSCLVSCLNKCLLQSDSLRPWIVICSGPHARYSTVVRNRHCILAFIGSCGSMADVHSIWELAFVSMRVWTFLRSQIWVKRFRDVSVFVSPTLCFPAIPSKSEVFYLFLVLSMYNDFRPRGLLMFEVFQGERQVLVVLWARAFRLTLVLRLGLGLWLRWGFVSGQDHATRRGLYVIWYCISLRVFHLGLVLREVRLIPHLELDRIVTCQLSHR